MPSIIKIIPRIFKNGSRIFFKMLCFSFLFFMLKYQNLADRNDYLLIFNKQSIRSFGSLSRVLN